MSEIMKDTYLVTVASDKYLKALNVYGPILRPTRVTRCEYEKLIKETDVKVHDDPPKKVSKVVIPGVLIEVKNEINTLIEEKLEDIKIIEKVTEEVLENSISTKPVIVEEEIKEEITINSVDEEDDDEELIEEEVKKPIVKQNNNQPFNNKKNNKK